MELIVFEDVPSSVTDEGMNSSFGNSFSEAIPIIEDTEILAETPAEMSIEIHDETTTETLAKTRTKTQLTQSSKYPPYLEQLTLKKVMEQPSLNLLGDLKNIYVRIPLLQALHDVPIYAKTVRDVVLKKLGRKPKDPPTVHVVGNLSELIMGKIPLAKYVDPGNPIVTVCIMHIQISNVLVNLGASINVMTIETLKQIGLANLRPTPTILEMANRSTIKPEGVVDDVVVSVDSWEYPVDFVVL